MPIDPEFPYERINYMLQESNTHIILSEDKVLSTYPVDAARYRIIRMEEIEKYALNTEERTQLPKCIGENPAYIIYTSGSTGKPKGVIIEHTSLYNFTLAMKENLGLTSEHTILALTTVSFDIWMLESLCALAYGLKVALADEKQQKELSLLKKSIIENQVDIIQATPSRVSILLEAEGCADMFNQVKLLLIGGEKLEQSLLSKVRQVYKGRIFNMYGPTETTIWSSTKELKDGEDITIGKPVLNTTFYILDDNLRIRPLGCCGELYIGGAGVARGYVNNQFLTEEKFIENPYNRQERIYKTGDIARRLSNGEVEVIGRNDSQIKLYGHRIELGEIEMLLMQYKGIQRAAVLKQEEENRSFLCAYVTGREEIEFTKVKEFLSNKLPSYMIPKLFMQLDKIPLTLNEKIDKTKLPKPDFKAALENKYKAAQNDIQRKIVSIWEEVLETDPIGLEDNFFDAGGDSILLVKMQSRINREFQCEISIADFFDNSTVLKIEQLLQAVKISSDMETHYGAIHIPDRFFSKEADSGNYANMSYALKNEGKDLIKEAANRNSCTVSDWLFGIFTYHLNSISEEGRFTVYTNAKNSSGIVMVEIEKKDTIDSFEELRRYIHSVNQKASDSANIVNTGRKEYFQENEVGIVFFTKTATETLTSLYDIIVEVKDSADAVKINLEYNEKLTANSMKIFLSQYIKLIKAVSEMSLK